MTTIRLPISGREAHTTGWRALIAPWVLFTELVIMVGLILFFKLGLDDRLGIDEELVP